MGVGGLTLAILASVASSTALHVPPSSVLGFSPREFEDIIKSIVSDQDQFLEPDNSAAYGTPLANLFIRLQRYLFKKGVLPVDAFGRPLPGKNYAEDWSDAPHLPRLSVNRFWDEVHHMVPAGAKCMEHFPAFYTPKHGNCRESWTFDFEPDASRRGRIDRSTLTLYDDVANLSQAALGELEGQFDVILATQVMELPSNPFTTLESWFRLLKPGGLLLTTQPFCERDVFPHTGWPDNFRYTDQAMHRMLRDTGYEVEAMYVGGNTQLTTSFLLGFGTEDHSPAELQATLIPANATSSVKGGPKDAIYYNTMAVARKPLAPSGGGLPPREALARHMRH